jgi:hypothetical protein
MLAIFGGGLLFGKLSDGACALLGATFCPTFRGAFTVSKRDLPLGRESLDRPMATLISVVFPLFLKYIGLASGAEKNRNSQSPAPCQRVFLTE